MSKRNLQLLLFVFAEVQDARVSKAKFRNLGIVLVLVVVLVLGALAFCAGKDPFVLQLFCSLSPIVNIRILEDEDDDEHEDDSSTSEFRIS